MGRGENYHEEKIATILTAAVIGATAFTTIVSAASGTSQLYPVRMVPVHVEHS